MSDILVVGSVAYDTINTPNGKREGLLGGSANYFSLSAALYSKVHVVGVIGEDYRDEDLKLLRDRNVDLTGLQKVPGKTFHWEGKYENDMNQAVTLQTQLNVFEKFDPKIPQEYKNAKYVFLANIDPDLQMHVFEQMKNPRLVGIDTMNFWISSKRDSLVKILKKANVLMINEGEARALADTWNTVAAAKYLASLGPKAVVIKRGEYGFLLYSEDQYFVLPAYPIEKVVDPTGAGDTFAGGFFGYLSKINSESWNFSQIKQACVHGCLLASFTVEDFGVHKLVGVDWAKVEKRQNEYYKIIAHSN